MSTAIWVAIIGVGNAVVIGCALLLNTWLTNKQNREMEESRQSSQRQDDREKRGHEEKALLRQERLLAYKSFLAITHMIAGQQKISNEDFSERYAAVEILASDDVRLAARDLFNEAWGTAESRGQKHEARLEQMKENRLRFREAIHSEAGWDTLDSLDR